MTYNLVIVHEDGAVISATNLPEEIARHRFDLAARTPSVVYAHFTDTYNERLNHYVRSGL